MEIEEWKVKGDVEVYTEEFWYDITDGGYLKPEEILSDQNQIKKLREAINLVRDFERLIDSLSEDS